MLEDLGSTNGTFVNGKKVAKTTLNDGDKLTVGRVRVRRERRGTAFYDSSTTVLHTFYVRADRYSSTKGFVCLSRPIVVSGPWPE